MDKDLEEMKKEIERLKVKNDLQAQLNELKQKQVAATPQTQANGMPEQLQRLMKLALPAGFVTAGIGIVFLIIFNDIGIAMTLCVFGAVLVGVPIGLAPKKPGQAQTTQDAQKHGIMQKIRELG